MKKINLILTFLVLTITTVSAQEISKNAIGLRLGDNDGIGTEISYQRKLNNQNRLEIGLGLRDVGDTNIFKATGLYQWVWHLDDRFNWYAGAGGGFLNSNDSSLFAAGTIGIEYNFNIPLVLSLDLRPEVGVIGDYDGFNTDLGLGIRYQF